MRLPPVDANKVSEMFGTGTIEMFIGRIILSFSDKNSLILLSCVSVLLFLALRKLPKVKTFKISTTLLALLFAFSMCFGSMLETSSLPLTDMFDGASQIVKIVLCFSAWFTIGYKTVDWLIDSSINKICMRHSDLIERILDFTPLIIFMLWLPSLVFTYPGILTVDVSNQMNSFFGTNTLPNDIQLLDPSVTINQHHPVLHTLLVGGLMSFGKSVFGSYEIGYFTYTLFQWCMFVTTISFMLRYMKQRGVDQIARLIVLIIVTIVPVFSGLALTGTKDALFTCGVVWFVMALDSICWHGITRYNVAGLIIGGIVFSFFRNGCFLGVAAAMSAAVVFGKFRDGKKSKVALLSIGIGVVGLYCVTTQLIFPSLKFTPGSQREMMSIPVQQIAAVVKAHGNELSDADKHAIDSVIEYDILADKYNPDISDPVKSSWKNDASDSEVASFMNTWKSLIARYPLTCVEATMRNYYQYLYPSEAEINYNTKTSNSDFMQSYGLYDRYGFHTSISPATRTFTTLYDRIIKLIERTPVIGLVVVSATWSWAMLVSIIKAFKERSSMRFSLISILTVFLIILIGPCNGYYFRYMYPIAMSMMLVLPIVFTQLPKRIES